MAGLNQGFDSTYNWGKGARYAACYQVLIMFRIHIDIPINNDKEDSIRITGEIVKFLETMKIEGVKLAQYKLSDDSDRANKNYLDINENGHCSNKKMKIEYR